MSNEKDYYNFRIHGVERAWERSELRELLDDVEGKMIQYREEYQRNDIK